MLLHLYYFRAVVQTGNMSAPESPSKDDARLSLSLFSKTLARNKIPDLEVLHAIQHHDII